MVGSVLKQFYKDVFWDNVDFMFIDMPPGTSDVPLTLFQSIPLDGLIVVTSPQDLVSMVVEKAVNMANQMNIKIFGIVENYSYLVCPDCGKKIEVFGTSHTQEVCDKYGLPLLAQVPIDPEIPKACDEARLEELDITALDSVVKNLLLDFAE